MIEKYIFLNINLGRIGFRIFTNRYKIVAKRLKNHEKCKKRHKKKKKIIIGIVCTCKLGSVVSSFPNTRQIKCNVLNMCVYHCNIVAPYMIIFNYIFRY